MARKPKRATQSPEPRRRRAARSDRDKAIDALMALLAEHSFEEIGLAEVAGRAGLKLSQLRAEFGSTLAILAAHIKDIDRAVLAGGDADMAEEPPRERLFDVLMRRLEALAPYKEAVRSMLRSARRNPGLALALNAMAVRSQTLDAGSRRHRRRPARAARLRAQGAALMFARVLGVWLDDDEPGLDRTMAALDRGLASAERWAGFLDDLCAHSEMHRARPRRRRARATRKRRKRRSVFLVIPRSGTGSDRIHFEDPGRASRGRAGMTALHRHPDRRPQAAERAVAERDVAAVRARDVARDRQPQAGAALVLIARVVEPQERLEHFLAHVRPECPARRRRR